MISFFKNNEKIKLIKSFENLIENLEKNDISTAKKELLKLATNDLIFFNFLSLYIKRFALNYLSSYKIEKLKKIIAELSSSSYLNDIKFKIQSSFEPNDIIFKLFSNIFEINVFFLQCNGRDINEISYYQESNPRSSENFYFLTLSNKVYSLSIENPSDSFQEKLQLEANTIQKTPLMPMNYYDDSAKSNSTRNRSPSTKDIKQMITENNFHLKIEKFDDPSIPQNTNNTNNDEFSLYYQQYLEKQKQEIVDNEPVDNLKSKCYYLISYMELLDNNTEDILTKLENMPYDYYEDEEDNSNNYPDIKKQRDSIKKATGEEKSDIINKFNVDFNKEIEDKKYEISKNFTETSKNYTNYMETSKNITNYNEIPKTNVNYNDITKNLDRNFNEIPKGLSEITKNLNFNEIPKGDSKKNYLEMSKNLIENYGKPIPNEPTSLQDLKFEANKPFDNLKPIATNIEKNYSTNSSASKTTFIKNCAKCNRDFVAYEKRTDNYYLCHICR